MTTQASSRLWNKLTNGYGGAITDDCRSAIMSAIFSSLSTWSARKRIMDALCWSLLAWSVILLVRWFDPDIQALEKFFNPQILASNLVQTAHVKSVDYRWIVLIRCTAEPRQWLIFLFIRSLPLLESSDWHLPSFLLVSHGRIARACARSLSFCSHASTLYSRSPRGNYYHAHARITRERGNYYHAHTS